MAWSFAKLFRPSQLEVNAYRLYQQTVSQARNPVFYETWGVPDTPLGRFDAIVLHCFLVLNRLKADAGTDLFAEKFSEAIFTDMDRSLREMGTGDLSVGKKVRKLAEGFYGRSAAYGRALEDGPSALAATLGRNLYGEAGQPDGAVLDAVAAYVRDSVQVLQSQPAEALMAGNVRFAPPGGE
jgi:cytochrome b pre-mRNA-processing protein 3